MRIPAAANIYERQTASLEADQRTVDDVKMKNGGKALSVKRRCSGRTRRDDVTQLTRANLAAWCSRQVEYGMIACIVETAVRSREGCSSWDEAGL